MLKFFLFTLQISIICSLEGSLKFLHLTFHAGCKNEIAYVAEELGVTVDALSIEAFFQNDFESSKALPKHYLLDITGERADGIWEANKEVFGLYDGYIISDTTPLSQIILRHEKKKPVIIWVCNRFDFAVQGREEYYAFFREIASYPNTYIVGYTPYENAQIAHKTGVFIDQVIKPIGLRPCSSHHFSLSAKEVPKSTNKKETFYFRDYPNTYHIGLKKQLAKHRIPFYSGSYRGLDDIQEFKGAIHIPWVMSNIQLFENLALGLPHFVPSKEFYRSLYRYNPQGIFILHSPPITSAPLEEMLNYSEWFAPEHLDLFVTFDSWDDLKRKILSTNYEEVSLKSKAFAAKHREEMLHRWELLFKRIFDENGGN